MIIDYQGPRLPSETQMKRVLAVIENELTETQQEVIRAYYFEEKNIPEIAAERGVHKSSVCRCLQRAEKKIRLCLKY
jgi:RNA polymerase sigma factor (sigma-70 family)